MRRPLLLGLVAWCLLAGVLPASVLLNLALLWHLDAWVPGAWRLAVGGAAGVCAVLVHFLAALAAVQLTAACPVNSSSRSSLVVPPGVSHVE
jgi:hypothetical protein